MINTCEKPSLRASTFATSNLNRADGVAGGPSHLEEKRTAERCQEISPVTRFSRTPGMTDVCVETRALKGREASHASSVRTDAIFSSRSFASLNPWLSSGHPFGVSFATETS